MLPEDEIQQLVARAKQQDQAAFGQIYDIYSQQLFNFLLGKLAHKQTAEDLLQTVFLKAWVNLSKYQTQSNAKFSTWLFQIANFTLIDHWRTKKPTVEITEVENLSQFAQAPALYEEYGYLWEALAELPLPYQTVLDLRFKRDLSVEETSIAMGKNKVGVRVLQHRALAALRKKIAAKLKNN
jgi:RNA polymerase sigma-70 factor, ECF subfamily